MIAITGVGLVDSIGSNLDNNFTKVINGMISCKDITNYNVSEYPIIPITQAHELSKDLAFGERLKDSEKRHLDRFILAGFYAAAKAIEDAGVTSSNAGIIYSSLHAGADTIHELHTNLNLNKRSHVKKMLSSSRDYLSNYISQKFQIHGVNLCITSACASGIVGLDYACKLLESGLYDYMIVGGVDLMVDPFSMYTFSSLGAMDTGSSPKTKPFDISRNGFTMGEGACCFILEPLHKVKDKKIYGLIRGIGLSNEAFHDTSMSVDARGARLSIDIALKSSGLNKTNIDIINCHATGTPNGDQVEYNIVSKYFKDKPVSALKANIGHTMGACSLLEIAYGLKSLETNTLIPIENLIDPIGPDIFYPQVAEQLNMKYMLKNSFGFGGKCGSVIIEKG